MIRNKSMIVIGGGLAGAEAAWQAAERGVRVTLYEMRPAVMTPAHQSPLLAELVCSNSLGSNLVDRAAGLLKEELRLLNSVIIECADQHAVPAGRALAVDRHAFAAAVTDRIQQHPHIDIRREEVRELPAGIVVLATGPLTSDALAESIVRLAGDEQLYFYDAMAPIVEAASIDMNVAFRASRYERGEGDYINLPMNREEYEAFVDALLGAEVAPLHEFEREDQRFFEGCLPLEVMAARGRKVLAYGPLKPMGFRDPRTELRPYAVVQLRQDNVAGTHYNIVGFQTNLKWSEQKRVFALIPGLQNAEYVRYGEMHRNTFINAPALLDATLEWRSRPGLFVGGQLCGTEGYVASTASGYVAGVNAARLAMGLAPVVFPRESMIGALCHYVSAAERRDFQPMKPAFGLLPALDKEYAGRMQRNLVHTERALAAIRTFVGELG